MQITFIHPLNFFKVQGATEAYYVYHYLNRLGEVLLITTSDPSEENKQSRDATAHYIEKKKSLLPYWLYFDLKALTFCLRSPFRRSRLFYTYSGVVFTPLFMKLLFKRLWVCDLRSAPVEQEREFSQVYGSFDWRRRVYLNVMKLLYRCVLKRCDLVITLSEPLKELLIRAYGVDPEKVYLQPLGVDLDLFQPRGEAAFQSESPRLVYVTSLGIQRGIQAALKALRLVKERGLKCQLLLVGSGPQNVVSRLKDVAEKEGVRDDVVWKGFVPHGQIPRILETCDIALCPLPDIESYRVASPTKVFEYLAMNKIVIASDIPSNRSVIRHRWNGLLTTPDDPVGLADAIVEIQQNRRLRRTLIRNARESVREYDWKVMLPQLESKLRSLLDPSEHFQVP